MSDYTFADVFGFGGGFAVGMTQAGFSLRAKRETSKFGVPNFEANRALLGDDWEAQIASPSREPAWDVVHTDVIAGNPPCSGFSTYSSAKFRGIESKANECMWGFANYVARCQPTIAVFESVQQAYTQGHELMHNLRASVELDTGLKYGLYHVLHNGLACGGAAIRPRYFWLISQVPFGVEVPEPTRVPTFTESIGDLMGLDLTWDEQPYALPATWWSESRRSKTGKVDGHITRHLTQGRRIESVFKMLGHDWSSGWDDARALKEIYDRHGRLPDEFAHQEDKIIDRKFDLGFNRAYRWHADQPCRVVTGDAVNSVVHPIEPRLITYREAFRIQGFPDDWRLGELRDYSQLGATPGKGIPVDAGRWIGGWIKRALDGNPGEYTGEPLGEREWRVDAHRGHKAALKALAS